MEKLLKYLDEVEGSKIHYNDGEEDITCPYGIYKKRSSSIYKTIVRIAYSIGIKADTSLWTKAEITLVNTALENYKETIDKYAEEFYSGFLKDAHIELFPKECQVAMYSMYTNSPRNAWKAVQESLIEFNVLYDYEKYLPLKKLSVIDGDFGDKTSDALYHISFKMKGQENHFETRMLSNMKSLYIKLWKSEEIKLQKGEVTYNKYSRHLSGWDNRMSHLEMMR